MEINIEHFKELLLKEKKQLEDELGVHGHLVDEKGNDWTAKVPPYVDDEEDKNVQADRIAQYETSVATLSELESRYAEVLTALKRIDEGTYGVCVISNHPIEKDRLEANPAARTCIEHIDQ